MCVCVDVWWLCTRLYVLCAAVVPAVVDTVVVGRVETVVVGWRTFGSSIVHGTRGVHMLDFFSSSSSELAINSSTGAGSPLIMMETVYSGVCEESCRALLFWGEVIALVPTRFTSAPM